MYLVDYIAAFFLIYGVWLIGKKKILGLYFNLIGSIIFMLLSFFVWNNIPLGITNVFMSGVNIIAIKNWSKKDE